jgi:hypothetical protein
LGEIEVWDVRAGRYAYSSDAFASQVGAVVVSVRGNVAWAACRVTGTQGGHENCRRSTHRFVEINSCKRPADGNTGQARVVVSKAWLDPYSLKLRGDKLIWRVKGTLHGIRFQ